MASFTRFPTPVFKAYWPFFTGAVITTYLMAKAADMSMNTEEFINDPRHPRFAQGVEPAKK